MSHLHPFALHRSVCAAPSPGLALSASNTETTDGRALASFRWLVEVVPAASLSAGQTAASTADIAPIQSYLDALLASQPSALVTAVTVPHALLSAVTGKAALFSVLATDWMGFTYKASQVVFRPNTFDLPVVVMPR